MIISKVHIPWHGRQLLKLDTQIHSHLLVEFCIQQGKCTATPPPIWIPPLPSPIPCSLQEMASRWYHRSVCLDFTIEVYGGSPGLMELRGDSYSKGHEFESHHCILEGRFSHLFVVKIGCVFEKTKNQEKEAVVGPFLNNRSLCFWCL